MALHGNLRLFPELQSTMLLVLFSAFFRNVGAESITHCLSVGRWVLDGRLSLQRNPEAHVCALQARRRKWTSNPFFSLFLCCLPAESLRARAGPIRAQDGRSPPRVQPIIPRGGVKFCPKKCSIGPQAGTNHTSGGHPTPAPPPAAGSDLSWETCWTTATELRTTQETMTSIESHRTVSKATARTNHIHFRLQPVLPMPSCPQRA